MFMMSEYAACVLLVIALSALVVILCGIVYLLKATSQLALRAFHSGACRPPEQSVRRDTSEIADCVS
jgi:hypothetical protein